MSEARIQRFLNFLWRASLKNWWKLLWILPENMRMAHGFADSMRIIHGHSTTTNATYQTLDPQHGSMPWNPWRLCAIYSIGVKNPTLNTFLGLLPLSYKVEKTKKEFHLLWSPRGMYPSEFALDVAVSWHMIWRRKTWNINGQIRVATTLTSESNTFPFFVVCSITSWGEFCM